MMPAENAPDKPVLRIPKTQRCIDFDLPRIMGIVNVNDDSFCGDGTLDLAEIGHQVCRMLAEGADVIDIGAESARTNRAAISVAEESARLVPVLEKFDDWVSRARPRDAQQLWPPLLSINTWRPAVAEAILPLGGDILNDMSALPTPENAQICAKHGAALLIMHSVGQPKVPHTHCEWSDILATQEAFFTEKLAMAEAAGLPRDALLVDPGIDFAKQKEDNLAIYRHAERLVRHACPVLLPVSRKTVIGDVLGIAQPNGRDAGTMACIVAGMTRLPAVMFRVHNVAAAAASVRVLHAVLSAPA